MSNRDRSDLVMQAVLRAAEQTDDRELKLHQAWLEAPDVVCFVYESQEQRSHGRVGLRRTIEQGPEWSVEGIADEVLTCEMGEPLGTTFETATRDDDGVLWWEGNRPEWKEPR